MGIKLFPELTDQQKQAKQNCAEMADLIIEEMKKRGLEPDDWMELQEQIDRKIYKQVRSVWK